MTPGDDPRADALYEAARVLMRHADEVAIEHGEHAARLVVKDAVIVSDLADEYPALVGNVYGRDATLDQTHADQYTRLIRFLEDHRHRSVDWALNQHHNGDKT